MSKKRKRKSAEVLLKPKSVSISDKMTGELLALAVDEESLCSVIRRACRALIAANKSSAK